jgi:hypothetical protein
MRRRGLSRFCAVVSVACLFAGLVSGADANAGGGGSLTMTASSKVVAWGRSFEIAARGTGPSGSQSVFNSLFFGINAVGVPCASSYSANSYELPPITKNPVGSFRDRERYDALFLKPGLHRVCAYLSFQQPGTTTEIDLTAQTQVVIKKR